MSDRRKGAGARPSGRGLRLTRRRLLVTSSATGVAALTGLGACAPVEKQEPWSDGTFWSDGTGWVEERSPLFF